jgi:murein L,D-transpeptidase YafK
MEWKHPSKGGALASPVPGRLAVCALLTLLLGVRVEAAPAAKADRVIIEKAARRLTLQRGSEVLRTYKVALGGHPQGPKQCAGDSRTPEGTYVIDARNGQSRYHRALHISYPSPADRKAAKKRGCAPGGDIMIHGLMNGYGWLGAGHRVRDWTQGCIAVTDAEIEEIWKLVPMGTPVEIRP